MNLTRAQIAAREAGCRSTLENPVISGDKQTWTHTWACGCTASYTMVYEGRIIPWAIRNCTGGTSAR